MAAVANSMHLPFAQAQPDSVPISRSNSIEQTRYGNNPTLKRIFYRHNLSIMSLGRNALKVGLKTVLLPKSRKRMG
ncbi:hypothetical protein PT276_06875 [Orbaceae bacterium ESL0721]|nr:hypothetical protein [Orbaceae bacterium ESL0721]